MLALLAALLFSALQAQPATPPRDRPPTQTGTGAISGRITDRDTGEPIARARVILLSWSGPRSTELEADADGRFSFTALAAGEYAVAAGPGEHQSRHNLHGYGRNEPIDEPSMLPRAGVDLKAGEIRRDVNISLTRALAIEGRVVDSNGEPMAEVSVSIVRPDSGPTFSTSTYTDDRGDYRAYGLPPGRYRVCAEVERGREVPLDTLGPLRTCHPASPGPAAAADVVLTAADVSGIDIQLQRAQTFTISGIVVDAAGVPADGGWINAGSLEDRNRTAPGQLERGRFTIRGLLPGRYLLRASVGDPSNPSGTRPPLREREMGFTAVDVSGSDVTNVTVTLSKAAKVAGRVVFEGDQAPQGRLRMTVQATVPGFGATSMMMDRPPSAAVDDNLTFELAGIYSLPMTVVASGLPDGWVLKSIRFDGRDVTGILTDFAAPITRPLEVVLTNRLARSEVRVTEDGTTPAAVYALAVLPADPARWAHTVGSTSPTLPKDGVSKLSPLPAGDYLVAAITMADWFTLMIEPQRIPDLATVATRVRLAENDNPAINLVLVRLPPRR
jgi:hypothetical protein